MNLVKYNLPGGPETGVHYKHWLCYDCGKHKGNFPTLNDFRDKAEGKPARLLEYTSLKEVFDLLEKAIKPRSEYNEIGQRSDDKSTDLSSEHSQKGDHRPSQVINSKHSQDELYTLTVAHCNIIKAALKLGAVNQASCKSQDDIAHASRLSTNVGNTKAIFSELRRRNFLQAKAGNRGGTWLTQKGYDIALKIQDQ